MAQDARQDASADPIGVTPPPLMTAQQSPDSRPSNSGRATKSEHQTGRIWIWEAQAEARSGPKKNQEHEGKLGDAGPRHCFSHPALYAANFADSASDRSTVHASLAIPA